MSSTPDSPIVARAGRYYRNTRYIMCVFFLAYGAWCIRDGFWTYPGEREAEQAKMARGEAVDKAKLHDNWDIQLNQALAVALPVISIGFLLFMLKRSGGEIRLDNQVIYAPGHPPVPFSAIRALDKRKWDAKGIARLEYRITGQSTVSGVLVLDDFIYQQDPIDKIVAAVEAYIKEAAAQAAEAKPAGEAAASDTPPAPTA